MMSFLGQLAAAARSGKPTGVTMGLMAIRRSWWRRVHRATLILDSPQAVVDRALDRDPLANRAEYLTEFRTDVESLLTQEAVQACVVPGVKERSPDLQHGYIASLTLLVAALTR